VAELEVLILDPPDGSAGSPPRAAIVAIHGRGATAEDLASLAEALVLPGVRWCFPQGWLPFPHAFGTGWAWFDLPPDHQPGILESRRRLTGLLDELAASGVPSERTVVAGFSQGAVMSLDVALRYPRRLAGVAALSGHLFEPESLAAELSPAQKQLPVFLAHGTEDDIIPIIGSLTAAQALRAAGLPVTLHEYRMAHQIIEQEFEDLRAFLAPLLQAMDGR
jgi:phospholipase/carboxylesterase